MPDETACLGFCFFDHQLFYAVRSSDEKMQLRHIGAVDFNFNIVEALAANKDGRMKSVRAGVNELTDRFDVNKLNILLPPVLECWATLPKRVHDDAREREAYINILMNGIPRKHIHPSWFALSNQDYRLLRLRADQTLEGIRTLADGIGKVDFLSTFEVGQQWIEHAHPGGSLLTISSFHQCLSVSSFILGKLRGVTYLTFDDINDLPYLWLQKARDLSWMQGLHENIQVCGHAADDIIKILHSYLDDAGVITKMDSLEKMQVSADEQTYGFDLAKAYPAVMLALT